METVTDTGSSPAPETGVKEFSGRIDGDQLFQELLKREEARVEEPEVEVEVPEVETEVPEEVPPEVEEPEAEPQVEEPAEEVEEPEPEEQEEEVLSQPEEEPRIPQKRLNKEVARRKDLEERLRKAQAREAELRETLQHKEEAPAPPPKDTLPDVTTPQALARLEEETEAAVDTIEERLLRQPDTVNEAGDEVYSVGQEQYTRQDMGLMLLNAKRRLRREIPQKKNYLQQKHAVEQKAQEQHPWLADNTSNEYQQFQAIDASRPWIMQNDPAGALVIAAAVEGLKVINARMQEPEKKTEPAKKKVAPPPVERAAAVPKRQPRSRDPQKRAEARKKQLLSKGKLESADVREFFLQQELDRDND